MGDETPEFNPSPKIDELPAHEPGTASWTAKPTSVKARSPINLHGKGVKRVGIAAAVVVVALLVMNMLPKDSSGAALALHMTPGDVMRYKVHLAVDGEISTNGGNGKAYSADATGVMTITVTDVDAQGVATAEVVVAAPGLSVTPPPRRIVNYPNEVSGEVKLAPNGTVISGSPNFAALLAATQPLPAGWDSVFPSLPEDPAAKEGTTWNTSSDVPFLDQTVAASDSAQLLSLGTDTDNVAVIKTDRELPFDITTTVSALIDGTGITSADLGLPEGSDPAVSITGSMNLSATYWMNAMDGSLDHSFAEGEVSVTRTISGLPKSEYEGGQEVLAVSGTAKLWVDPAKAPVEKAPKAEGGTNVETEAGG